MNASSAATSGPEPLLQVHDLCAGYGGRRVLNGVSLEVYPHETVALIGLNGAGKTTLLRTVMGYVRPWSGRIRLRGHNLIGLHPHDVARLGVAYVPQDQTIFPNLSVREHLEVGATILPTAARKPQRDQVYHLFPRLHEREGQKASTLSGGERQMLSIARALMANPTMLMLDEPSLGLAPKVVDTIFSLLDEIHRSGTTILLVEQNAAVALAHSQRAYILETGSSKQSGPCAELAARPDIRAAYLWGME